MVDGYQVAEQDAGKQRGPQAPNKYPQVGRNYQYWGEVAGYIYNPYTDQYYPDPKAYEQWQYDTGLKEKPAGLAESLLPVAGGMAAIGLGQAAGKQIPGMLGGLLGSGAATPATTATTGAATGGSSIAAGIGQIAPAAVSESATGTAAGASGTGSGMLGGIGSNIGSMGGLSSIAVPAAVIGGTIMGGQAAYDMLKGRDANPLGRGLLGIATGGLSEVAKATGLIGRKSTKDYQKERWGKLSPELQGLYAANHPDNDTGVWSTGKYAGEKWTFDKAKDLAKDDPTHFIGVLGNLETFGDDWLSLPIEKQKQVVSALVANDIYHSDKGDVIISDKKKQKAKEIYNNLVNDKKADDNKPAGLLGITSPISAPATMPVGTKPASATMQASTSPSGLFGVTGAMNFEPNSAEYNKLSKAEKDQYWAIRNG